jgi:hypothetical protein
MAKCDVCGTTILFGGKTVGNYRCCSDKCVAKSPVLLKAAALTSEEVKAELDKIHQGACPQCGGPGPTDIHWAHQALSFVIMSTWSSKPTLGCKSCGRKAQIKALAITLVGGWWGFPWGLLMTPIQIVRDIAAIAGGPKPDTPSPELEKLVRTNLAERRLAEEAAGTAPISAPPIPSVPLPSNAAKTQTLPQTAAAQPQSTPQSGSPFTDIKPFGS